MPLGWLVLRELVQEIEKKMWLLNSNREGSRDPMLRLVPSFLTAKLLFLGLAPGLPTPIQMIIIWVLGVLKPPSWTSDNPSSFVKQLAFFPLPGEIRDFVVYRPQSGVEAKRGSLSEEPGECLFQGSDKGNWWFRAFLFLGSLFFPEVSGFVFSQSLFIHLAFLGTNCQVFDSNEDGEMWLCLFIKLCN